MVGAESRLPVTIVTGFAGAGKTTLILNLLPQLRRENPGYKLALIKNEIGDLNVDSQLAAAAEMAGSKELLGDCICCTNVGQVGDALATLDRETQPDRVIIETSGSAEPLKLVLEVNRLSAETGRYELDGVVSVVDAENWTGYANTSYTAKLQAQQTDMIIINKWEDLNERAFDIFLDRLGDLDVDTPQVKSDRGWISKDLLFGFDQKLARAWRKAPAEHASGDDHGHNHADHDHDHSHKSEMECISVTVTSSTPDATINMQKLHDLLKTAPKDEVYRIKAILYAESPLKNSDGSDVAVASSRPRCVLNWSFGRWTWACDNAGNPEEPVLRMSVFTAPYESTKWMKRIKEGGFLVPGHSTTSEWDVHVKRVQ